jgi:hypothetical protein
LYYKYVLTGASICISLDLKDTVYTLARQAGGLQGCKRSPNLSTRKLSTIDNRGLHRHQAAERGRDCIVTRYYEQSAGKLADDI